MPSDIVATTGKTSSDIENVDWSTGTTAGTHFANVVRFGSSSSQASQSSGDICRICHCESDPQNPLLTPCYCSGSLKYVHQACLQQWLTASETNACELCKFPFIMHTKIKPFNEWRSLDMSGVERRRLCCAVLFHCAAALCVIWSLCVLIERAAEEVKRNMIGWPFWTKLAVVTVGLTGGVVFMYIQCRQYLHLCHRWRARNRILLIQNAPEKVHPLSPPSPLLPNRHIPRNNSATAASAMTTNSFNYSYATAANRSNSTVNQSSYGNAGQHGQIVANIENNSQNYDRDWTLDDVSQISSFRPCPQGSGSMTPFHDSVHNALENSRSCSNSISGSRQDLNNLMPNNSSTGSNKTNDLDLFKTPGATAAAAIAAAASASSAAAMTTSAPPSATLAASGATASGNLSATTSNGSDSNCLPIAQSSKYPNSSVFLENRDILNDAGYPKINYRHSSVLMSPDITDNLDKFLGKDLRRYSDTKLLQHDNDLLSPIFNVALHTESEDYTNQHHYRQPLPLPPHGHHSTYGGGSKSPYNSHSHSRHHSGLNGIPSSPNDTLIAHNLLGAPQITDIIFENANQLDPLELNIQELLDADLKQHLQQQQQQQTDKKSRHSLNTVDTNDSSRDDNIDKSRMFFKSLPNLSGSCESLLKKEGFKS